MRAFISTVTLGMTIAIACRPGHEAVPMRGLYRYLADAGRFTDCATGAVYPVAQAGANADLERAYAAARSAPGASVLITFTGYVEERPGMEGDQTIPHVIVDDFESALPDVACDGRPVSAVPEGSAWVLLGARPGAPPRLFFDATGKTRGYTGCNNFTGGYTRHGDSLRFGPLAVTRRACLGEALNRQEHAFTTALEGARTWSISGDTLALAGEAEPLARFTRSPM